MTEERIDIIIQDKVEGSVKNSLQFIANAARTASGAVIQLQKELNKINASNINKIVSANKTLDAATLKQQKGLSQLNILQSKSTIAQNKAALSAQKLAQETNKASLQVVKLAKEQKALEAATLRAATAQTKQGAVNNIASTAQQLRNSVRPGGAGGLSRQQIQQATNLSYQLSDVAVGLASGQKPLTILIQQGLQIKDIFGANTGIVSIFKQLGTLLGAILVPMLPVIAAVGAIAGGIGLLQRALNKGKKDVLSFGDVFKGVFMTLWDYTKTGFKNIFGDVTPFFSNILDGITSFGKLAINSFIGLFVGLWNVVKTFVSAVPDLASNIIASSFNTLLTGIEIIINAIKVKLNDLINTANIALSVLGQAPIINSLDMTSLAGNKMPLKDVGNLDQQMADAWNNSQRDFAGGFGSDVEKNARKAKAKRLEDEAKKGGKKFTYSDGVKELQDEIALLKVSGGERRVLKAILEIEQKTRKSLTAAQKEEITTLVQLRDVLKAQGEVMDSIQDPINNYKDNVQALNTLLANGSISAAAYNSKIGALQLNQDVNAIKAGSLNPALQDAAAQTDVLNQYADSQMKLEQALEAQAISRQEYADLSVQIEKDKNQRIKDIEINRYKAQLDQGEQAFGSLADAAKAFGGEQSKTYKKLFKIQKTFALASATVNMYQAISSALATQPFFPMGLIQAGIATAAGLGQIGSITASVLALKDGGLVTGPGTGRSDSIPADLSNGEFVMNARATAANLPLLRAMNDNNMSVGGSANPQSGTVIQSKGVAVQIYNYGTSKAFEVQQISPDEVRIISRDEAEKAVQRSAPSVIASDLSNPNGTVSKALDKNTNTQRRR